MPPLVERPRSVRSEMEEEEGEGSCSLVDSHGLASEVGAVESARAKQTSAHQDLGRFSPCAEMDLANASIAALVYTVDTVRLSSTPPLCYCLWARIVNRADLRLGRERTSLRPSSICTVVSQSTQPSVLSQK